MSRLPVGVRRRGDRFEARWRDQTGRGRSASFATADEAAARLLALRTGTTPNAEAATVGEWHQRWRATAHGRPSTLARDARYLRTHFLPTFGDRPIDEITTWELQEWVTTLSERLAPASTHKVHIAASKIFTAALAAQSIHSIDRKGHRGEPRCDPRYLAAEQATQPRRGCGPEASGERLSCNV